MSDPSSAPAISRTREEVAEEIGRSLSSIWQRRGSFRPAAVETEYVGDVVRCVMERGESPAEDDAAGAGPTDANGYGREAQATVARLTRRSVAAYIPKRNAKTGNASTTFILEPVRVKH
jgi:hypothetical protein